jgi:site-specific DNA recombinase
MSIPTATPIRGVLYCRKSNDDEGESIDQQGRWADEACAREGVVLVASFADQSVAGWDTARRSDFHRMIAFCEEQARLGQPVETVVCWKANRFSRADSLETAAFLHQLRQAGTCRMLTKDRWIDFNVPEDRMIFGLQQEATEHRYALNLSDDTRRGKRAAASKGLWNGGKPPFGYAVENQKLVPHPTEADMLRWLFETYANTDVSIRGLADRLQERGIASPNGKPLWRPATVAKVLANVLYLGDSVFGRKSYSPFPGAVKIRAGHRKPSSGRPNPRSEWVTAVGSHRALVSRELFDRVQSRLAANRVRKSPRKTAPFALSGLLVCGHCGRRMVAQTSHVRAGDKVHKYRLYTCASYHVSGAASGCGHNTVDERRMVRAVGRKLSAAFTTPDAVADLRSEILRQELAEAVEQRERELESQDADLTRRVKSLIKRLGDDLPRDVLAEVEDEIRELSDNRGRVRGELAKARAGRLAAESLDERVGRFVARVHHLSDVLQDGEPAAVSALLRELIDRVVVHFTHTRTAKRTRAAFARALLHLQPEAWFSPPRTSLPDGSAGRLPGPTAHTPEGPRPGAGRSQPPGDPDGGSGCSNLSPECRRSC